MTCIGSDDISFTITRHVMGTAVYGVAVFLPERQRRTLPIFTKRVCEVHYQMLSVGQKTHCLSRCSDLEALAILA